MTETGQIYVSPEGKARIEGVLTLDTVASVYAEANRAAGEGRRMITLDLCGVSRVDSSGLALLLEWQSVAKRDGRSISIHSAPADLQSLAGLCEAADLLSINGRDNRAKDDFQLLQEATL
jgi:phospholipid transport system transporter-binding protein